MYVVFSSCSYITCFLILQSWDPCRLPWKLDSCNHLWVPVPPCRSSAAIQPLASTLHLHFSNLDLTYIESSALLLSLPLTYLLVRYQQPTLSNSSSSQFLVLLFPLQVSQNLQLCVYVDIQVFFVMHCK